MTFIDQTSAEMVPHLNHDKKRIPAMDTYTEIRHTVISVARDFVISMGNYVTSCCQHRLL